MEHRLENHNEADLAVVQGWAEALMEIDQRIGRQFARSEARQETMSYLRGLLSPMERKNCWERTVLHRCQQEQQIAL